MKRIPKGGFGYINYQRKMRILKTVALFILPITLFVVGLIQNGGDRKNILTLLAIVGVIPACMSVVSVIMVFLKSSISKDLYEEVESHTANLSVMYEVYLTTHDENIFLSALAIDDDYVTAYTEEKADAGKISIMEKHITSCLKLEHLKRKVKIFTNKKQFTERLEDMNARNNGHDRDQDSGVIAVLKAVSV